jgi:hypothetical protein
MPSAAANAQSASAASIDAHNVTHVINYDSAAGSPPQSPLLRAASSVSEQRLCNVSVDDVFQVSNYGLPG